MKKILPLLLAALMTGCVNVHQTKLLPINPPLQSNMIKKIRVDGFGFEYIGYSGSSHATAYNLSTGNTATASSTHHSRQHSNSINTYVCRTLENLGINVRSKEPKLILVGQVGAGELDLSYVFSDSLINIASLTIAGLSRRKNWCRIRIYTTEGEFLKEYSSNGSHSHTSIGIPFHAIGVSEHTKPYMNEFAALHAVHNSLNDFFIDVNQGFYQSVLATP